VDPNRRRPALGNRVHGAPMCFAGRSLLCGGAGALRGRGGVDLALAAEAGGVVVVMMPLALSLPLLMTGSDRRGDGRGGGRYARWLRPLWRPVLAEIYLCNVCSCQEILRRNGRGQRLRLACLTARGRGSRTSTRPPACARTTCTTSSSILSRGCVGRPTLQNTGAGGDNGTAKI
jgi:hypothetical protein